MPTFAASLRILNRELAAPVKAWLKLNRLPLTLLGLLFLAEIVLMNVTGSQTGTVIYRWMVDPSPFCGLVIFMSGLAIAASFLIRPVRWYVHTLVIALFVIMIPIGLLVSFRISPLFHRANVAEGSFHGRVYYLAFSPELSDGGDHYYLYECDGLGIWCSSVDVFSKDAITGMPRAALVADPVTDVLHVMWTDPKTGVTTSVREYRFATRAPVSTPSGP